MKTVVHVSPIENEADFDRTLKRMRQLAESAEGSVDAAEYEVLAALASEYERKHHREKFPVDPIEAIKHVMDAKGLRPVDLIPYLGATSRVSEILGRKRGLTVGMIRKLHAGLGIPVDVLIGTAEPDKRSA